MPSPKTLSDLASSRPTDSHWLVPGTIVGGTKTLIVGGPGAGKTMLAAEMAVSTTTMTPFCGGVSPWIGMPTAVFTRDPWQLSVFVNQMLAARNRVAPTILYHQNYTDLKALHAILNMYQHGMVIFDTWEEQYIEEAIDAAANKRWTVVVLVQNSDTPLVQNWVGHQLRLERDFIKRVITLTSEHRAILRVMHFNSPTAITFARLPTCPMTPVEERLWGILRTDGPQSPAELVAALELHCTADAMSDVLESMSVRGLVKAQHDTWIGSLPEGDDV